MAIFLDDNSRIIVQGITGSEGLKHARRMSTAGAQIVGGVNPKKAGSDVDLGNRRTPVFGTVAAPLAARKCCCIRHLSKCC